MSDEQEDKDKQVKFVFKYDPDYRLIPCNGVWGGMTTRGDLKLDFMVESQATPDYVVHVIDVEAGELGKEIEREPPKHFIRELQVGILMSPDTAVAFADWLNGKLKEIEKLSGKNNSEGALSESKDGDKKVVVESKTLMHSPSYLFDKPTGDK